MSDDSTRQPTRDTSRDEAVGGANDGLITVRGGSSVPDTIARLEETIVARGMQVFAHIDHAAGAAHVGMALRPTTLLIFGNPRGGTPLMQERQTAGLDLPLKVLAWEDAGGAVWLTYNDPAWLARRHGLGTTSHAAVAALSAAMASLTTVAERADAHGQDATSIR
jgi:uncharacterized protein (DUF302 family)